MLKQRTNEWVHIISPNFLYEFYIHSSMLIEMFWICRKATDGSHPTIGFRTSFSRDSSSQQRRRATVGARRSKASPTHPHHIERILSAPYIQVPSDSAFARGKSYRCCEEAENCCLRPKGHHLMSRPNLRRHLEGQNIESGMEFSFETNFVSLGKLVPQIPHLYSKATDVCHLCVTVGGEKKGELRHNKCKVCKVHYY